jgi:hypothetical protein
MNTGKSKGSQIKLSPNRILTYIICAIAVASLLVIVLTAKRSPIALDRNTPQGVVQSYLSAVLSGKTEEASKYLSPKSNCQVSDLDRAFVTNTSRVDLIKTDIYGTTAQVRVNVEFPSEGPVFNTQYEEHSLRLIRTDGKWLLTGIPWPLYDCGPVQK